MGVYNLDILLSFLSNVFTVIGIAALGSLVGTKYSKYKNLIWGVLFGIGVILLTRNAILILPGRSIGLRYLIMTFAGYFGGVVSVIIAGLIHAAYRWLQGGINAQTGIMIAFIFGFIGYYLRRFNIEAWGVLNYILLSEMLTALMLFLIFITPLGTSETLQVIQIAAFPLFFLAPLGFYVGFRLFFILNRALANHLLLHEQFHLVKQTRKRFYKVFNMNPNIMMLIADGVYIDVNESFIKATGLCHEEIIGRSVDDLNLWHDINEKKRFDKQFSDQGRIHNYEMKYRTLEGPRAALFTLDKLEDTSCFLGVITDIEAKKQHEEDIGRFDRLNLIGEMAAAIGHEVRNPMTTVRGYLQLFQQKEKFQEYHKQFQLMIEELDRANSIITEFLSLAKNKTVEMAPGNLNEIIHTLFPLLQADAFQMGHDIQVATTDIPDIQLNQKEIRQLILNLTRNGLEAMKSAGKITIQTFQDEDKVTLAIQDTGPGIPEELKGKLGTPFITTKETGTGLGLSVCYRIAQRHNALIDVITSRQGTTFLVHFHKTDGNIGNPQCAT